MVVEPTNARVQVYGSCLLRDRRQLLAADGHGEFMPMANSFSWQDQADYNISEEIGRLELKLEYVLFGYYSLTREGMAMVVDQTKQTMRKMLQCAFNLHQTADTAACVEDEVQEYFQTSGADIGKFIDINSRSIQTAVRLILPVELCTHAVSEGNEAVTKGLVPVP